MQLVADRFVVEDSSDRRECRAIDLATGAGVILTIGSAGSVSEQTQWTLRCDGLHRLHHRSIAPLLDFGIIGESSRFEAWRCGGTWQGSPQVACAVRERADRFLSYCSTQRSLLSAFNLPILTSAMKMMIKKLKLTLKSFFFQREKIRSEDD